MARPVTETREIARLLEELEKHPEALGYLKKFENADPVAGPWKNPLWYRGQLEETILYHAQYGDGACLDMLLYADIKLNVFERYHVLMAGNRLNAVVEDVFAGRRISSRTGVVFNNCLTQLVDTGNTELFEEKLLTLLSMGGRKLLASPITAANLKPQDFFHAKDIRKTPETLARFRLGVARLLDAGMTNILQHLTRPVDPALLTGVDKFSEDVGREKENKYNHWADYLKALVIGHNPERHGAIPILNVGACGAVFATLREVVKENDLDAFKKISASFDLEQVYATLDAFTPLKRDVSKTFKLEEDGASFTPISLLLLAMPRHERRSDASELGQADSKPDDFEMFDLLKEGGLSRYLDQGHHKGYFAAGLASHFEAAPDLFDVAYEKAGLGNLVDDLSNAELVSKALNWGYVGCSFYQKRIRESESPEMVKIEMLKNLNRKEQERLFESPGLMKRFGVVDADRQHTTSDTLRTQLMAIDLGL
ncbi:hypothetical protein IFT48_00060 [Pseudomonas fluorescens]|uniref:hypothetical protein n=1 Tax=Pseudomonas fluorescens TaxID=294 RepID=UPI001930DB38|nr:hypothetical protein [Pseudomonas fluorescens]MBD8088385.1 hypothetical protein [Pseudomonas fluorescens]